MSVGLALVLGQTACAPSPLKGDVVAVVNGREITTQDLQAEARAEKLSGSRDMAKALLERVIARVLLAQHAHRSKLDAYPGYPSDVVRAKEALLANLSAQALQEALPEASDADVAAYMRAHPLLFAGRSVLTLEEVTSARMPEGVRGAPSLAALQAELRARHQAFETHTAKADTAYLPPPEAETLTGLKPNDILFLDGGDQTVGTSVLSRRLAAQTPDEEASRARQLMAQEARARQVEAEAQRLRGAAVIRYQPGYASP